MLEYKLVPEDVAKTSLPQTWHIPRGDKIGGKEVQDVEVHSYKKGATNACNEEDLPKPIKSTLFNPIRTDITPPTSMYSHLSKVEPTPMVVDYLSEEVQKTDMVGTKYGPHRRGSVLSYQQKLQSGFTINDYSNTEFPTLPVNNVMCNNVSICLTESQMAIVQDLQLTNDQIADFEVKTRVQSATPLWHKLRKGRITATKVGPIVKRQKDDVTKFLQNLKSTRTVQTQAMKLGIANEPLAAVKYSSQCEDTVNVYPCGIIISPYSPWLAASPDRKVYNPTRPTPFGLLEIKCLGAPTVSAVECLSKDAAGNLFLKRNNNYYYQVMTQIAVAGVQWCDFFIWCEADDSCHLETIYFDPTEWQRMKDKLDLFYFAHYL